jgi:sporulation protein YlmC with PRC-barrel domain
MGRQMNGVEVLNKRVVMRGIELGRVVDVILDEDGGHPVGFDVRCRDGEHRFLPLAAARVGEEDVQIESPLMMLETEQLDFYRSHGRTLRSPG